MIVLHKRIIGATLYSLVYLLFVMGTLSCISDSKESSGDGSNSDDRGDADAWFDAGEDCNSIEATKQYTPQDEIELKQLIQKDIKNQGSTVNLNYLNTSGITTMAELFATTKDNPEGVAFNGVLHCWDVSKVEDMSAMFKGAVAFNADIKEWDVSKVTNMNAMFQDAKVFNQDLTSWKNTVQATVSTESMFAGSGVKIMPDWNNAGVCFHPTNHKDIVADKAELQETIYALITADSPSPNLNHIEVCNVKDMSELFKDKVSFNGAIDTWNVSRVTTMESMFSGARAFNNSINDWDVSEVTNMALMFYKATTFNQPLSSWNVSKVTRMHAMFSSATAFNQPLTTWNVGQVTTMNSMFSFTPAFNQALDWDVSNVTTMDNMFASATAFNQSLANWDVSHVTNMSAMFNATTAFNQSLDDWDISEVTIMSVMFFNARAFCQDLSSWGDKIKKDDQGTNTTKINGMFYNTGTTDCDPSTASPPFLLPPQWYVDATTPATGG